jgi:hypothetical protein
VSESKSEFILTEDGIDVYVEHGDFGAETMHFIHGIAQDVWFEEVENEDDVKECREKQNPTLRWWKKHQHPPKPNLHLTKGRFRFVPPESMCLLGEKVQYDQDEWGAQVKIHPACACDRCKSYSRYRSSGSESQGSYRFWQKITGRIEIEV